MNQSIQCPICGKEGISDFHKKDVVCPCCNSDLSIYNRLREVTEIKLTSSNSELKRNQLPLVLSCLLAVALLSLGYLVYYRSTYQEDYLYEKETEINKLKKEISLLQDSISKLNSNIIEDPANIYTPPPSKEDYKLYIVRRGDSIRKISRVQLGTEQRFEEIAILNSLTSNVIIHPGDTLRIPNK